MNAPAHHLTQLAYDVRRGLDRPGQKELPASYLYDELGSALFEAITLLPEYGLTRADARLLRTYSREIAARVEDVVVAELGSGGGSKTRHVLEAIGRTQPVDYYPIDVSAAALRACAAELAPVAAVHPVHASYVDGLRRAARDRHSGQRLLVLFLGSTIGNFDRDVADIFLQEVRSVLSPGDHLLIGADLVKSVDRMIDAYDDALGVTAAFNKNILVRINRELDGKIDVRSFDHEVRWNFEHRRIEMHLRSTCEQVVELPQADLKVHFDGGETIWTESSHKFEVSELSHIADRTGFRQEKVWIDREWPFAECLWRA